MGPFLGVLVTEKCSNVLIFTRHFCGIKIFFYPFPKPVKCQMFVATEDPAACYNSTKMFLQKMLVIWLNNKLDAFFEVEHFLQMRANLTKASLTHLNGQSEEGQNSEVRRWESLCLHVLKSYIYKPNGNFHFYLFIVWKNMRIII